VLVPGVVPVASSRISLAPAGSKNLNRLSDHQTKMTKATNHGRKGIVADMGSRLEAKRCILWSAYRNVQNTSNNSVLTKIATTNPSSP
jgi:hypothetical protein